MDQFRLLELIGNGETSTVQFKETFPHQFDSISQEMVAMSNAKGGIILFGIEDKTGKIKGLSYSAIQDINNKVANIATNNINPMIYITTEALTVDEKSVLVVYIDEGVAKPYKDNQGVIWMKQGSDKRRVTDNNEILRLFQHSGTFYADEQPIPYTNVTDINKILVNDFVQKEYGQSIEDIGLSYEKLLSNLNILREGKLSLAGLLYFGNNPQQYRPSFIIKAVSFFGNDIAGKDYRDSKDITGTIPELFDRGMSFFKSNLQQKQNKQGFNTIGQLEISKIALEELLQNALVHRDYTKNASIRLLIFDDRIEIISPGKLPNSLTIDNIKFGNAVVRNNIIASLCAKTMPYRGLGSGIKRAMKEEPEVELINDVEGEQFIVKIPRKK
jgi:predicted HTH transcriptional regulator